MDKVEHSSEHDNSQTSMRRSNHGSLQQEQMQSQQERVIDPIVQVEDDSIYQQQMMKEESKEFLSKRMNTPSESSSNRLKNLEEQNTIGQLFNEFDDAVGKKEVKKSYQSKFSKAKRQISKARSKKKGYQGGYKAKLQKKKEIDLDEQTSFFSRMQSNLQPIHEEDDFNERSPMNEDQVRNISLPKKYPEIRHRKKGDMSKHGLKKLKTDAKSMFQKPQNTKKIYPEKDDKDFHSQDTRKSKFSTLKGKTQNLKFLMNQISHKSLNESLHEIDNMQSKNNIQSYDDLKYGSTVTISIAKNQVSKKLSTKYRISEKVICADYDENEYSINSVFKVLPSSQFHMQEKILDIIEEDDIPEKIDIDYENFSSEMDSNVKTYNLSLNESVRFEDNVQLFHDSSKRFLCYKRCKIDEIRKAFEEKFADSECFYLGFSDYPSDNTNFGFETVPAYQHEEDGCIKKFHFLYLTCMEKGKKYYFYHGKKCFLTETYKTPLSINVIREAQQEDEERVIGRTDVVLISFANENFYLNCPQVIDESNGRFQEANVEFHKWQDMKTIDFNGWWQLESNDDSLEAVIRNFNNGKYLKYANPTAVNPCPIQLVEDREEASTFAFLPINSGKTDINTMTETDIFKINIGNQSSLDADLFISMEIDEDADEFFDEDSYSDIKKVRAGAPSEVNTFDAFKFIIPKDDEYRELSLCLDLREYVDNFVSILDAEAKKIQSLKVLKEGLSKIFIQLLDFMQNKLKGKTRVEYSIGQIVPHRQEMISKVGILEKLFDLLEIIDYDISKSDIKEKQEEIIEELEIDPDDFEGFDNLIEIVIKAIHVTALNNSVNIIQCISNLGVIQNFVFIDG